MAINKGDQIKHNTTHQVGEALSDESGGLVRVTLKGGIRGTWNKSKTDYLGWSCYSVKELDEIPSPQSETSNALPRGDSVGFGSRLFGR